MLDSIYHDIRNTLKSHFWRKHADLMIFLVNLTWHSASSEFQTRDLSILSWKLYQLSLSASGFPQKFKITIPWSTMKFPWLFNALPSTTPFSGIFTMRNAEKVMYLNKHACRLCMHFEIIKTRNHQ